MLKPFIFLLLVTLVLSLEFKHESLNRSKRSSSESRIVTAFHDARRSVSNFFAKLFRVSGQSSKQNDPIREEIDLYGAASRKGSKKSLDQSSQYTLKQQPNYKIDMSRFRRDQQYQVASKGKYQVDQLEDQIPAKTKQAFEPYHPQRSYQEQQTFQQPQKSVQTPRKQHQEPLKHQSQQTSGCHQFEHLCDNQQTSKSKGQIHSSFDLQNQKTPKSHSRSWEERLTSFGSYESDLSSYSSYGRLNRNKREKSNKNQVEAINQEMAEIERDYDKLIQSMNEKIKKEPNKTFLKKRVKLLQHAADRLQTFQYILTNIRLESGQTGRTQNLDYLNKILKKERKFLDEIRLNEPDYE